MKNKAAVIALSALILAVAGVIYTLNSAVPDSPVIDAPLVNVPDLLFADGNAGASVMMERFDDFYEQNNDLVGWIRVPGTVIDYPVVYCDDNNYYLNYDFLKRPTKDGTPFLDMSADLYEKNHSLSLYGHYLGNGRMFTALHNYKDLDYYKSYPLFQFDTLYGEEIYKIFSVFYMAGNRTDGLFYYYPVSHFNSDEAFIDHVREISVRSIFNTTVDVIPGDRLVLMTCCTYEVDNLRLIVAGRRQRDNESLFVDTENAVRNPAPLYPQKWYDVRGGSPPDLSKED